MINDAYLKNNKHKTNYFSKTRSKTKSQYMLFVLVVACCLGEYVKIFGAKLSWIAAILTLCTFLFENANRKIIFQTKKLRNFFMFFIFWAIYALLQMLFIVQKSNAIMAYFSFVINIFIVIIILLNIHNISDVIFINKGLIAGLIINLIISLWEISTQNHIIELDSRNLLFYQGKALGVYGNGNDLATFICIGIISIILNYTITNKNKLLSLFIILASLFVLIKIDARAPIYGMIIYGVCFLIFLIFIKMYKYNKGVFYFLIYIFGILCILAGIIIFSNYSLEDLFIIFSSPGNLDSDLFRLELNRGAIKLFSDSLYLGVGSGQSITLLGINVHNFFLEILCEYGILIISGVSLIFIYFIQAYKYNLPTNLKLCIISFTPSFIFISVSSSGANRIRAIWIIIAIMYLTINLYKERDDDVKMLNM